MKGVHKPDIVSEKVAGLAGVDVDVTLGEVQSGVVHRHGMVGGVWRCS